MTAPGFLDVFHLESRYPIFDRICSYLPIASIIALTRTCRGLSGLYQSLLPLQWNVDRLLSRFVRDPQFFRSQLGRHNALVSGSVALQLFERVLWKESDLDIFIERGDDAEAFAKYLIEEEGYKFLARNEARVEYKMSYIVETRTYTRRSVLDMSESKAQIIFTSNIPVEAILKNFHSTLVVNFFTWNKAYAIFPLPTFVHHKGYLLKPLDNYLSTLLQKYSRRGWRFQGEMWPEEVSANQPIQVGRRIGDEFTWMIPFNTSNVNWSKTPDLVLEYSSFKVEHGGPDGTNYEVSATRFQAEVLRHQYLYGAPDWMKFLGKRVDELTILELYKLAPELRPAPFRGPLYRTDENDRYALYRMTAGGFMRETGKPDGWTYWDDEVPKWYQAWRQSVADSKVDSESKMDTDV